MADPTAHRRPAVATAGRLRLTAAALTLASGGVMMAAGWVGERESWTAAGFVTVPGGVLILAALLCARRADEMDARPASPTPPTHRLAAMAATLASGAVMVAAGYAAAAGTWALVAPLALLGGAVIALAFAVDRRGRGER